MLDRPRRFTLAWGGVCLALFAVLALLVISDRSPLDAFDQWGSASEDWADDFAWFLTLLRGVEAVFSTWPMVGYTAVLAIALFARDHRRAAYYAVGVMLTTSLLTTLVKVTIGRQRPDWQDAAGILESKSFPSGHASSIVAFAGILIIVSLMLIRRANLRRAAYAGAVTLAVAVCWDRVLLGRHYPTDVIAGALLGLAVLLIGLAIFSPLPRSHAGARTPIPDALPTTRQLAVVLNPVKVEDESVFRATVTSMATRAGWSTPTWHLTTVEDPGAGMAEAAAVEGADLVIVCGGDGTVREVCAELAGTGIPVGIVPAGTGNLLARNLDIPLYLRAAIDVALTGQDRAIDLVEVSGDGFDDTHFMVMAGMGLDAAIMEGVNEETKKKVGWFAYVFSALRSLMHPPTRIDISIDGQEFTRHRARTVVVGNVGYLQAGMPLLPDARIDDGLLDVVILDPRRFLSWIPLAVRVLAKRQRLDDTINRMTGRLVTLRATADTPRQLDGDTIGPGRELRMRCVQGRLLVRVPR